MGDDLRGITIGGKDLAEELQKEEGQNLSETMIEPHYAKKKTGVRYMEHKEKPSEVKRTSQQNLNIINKESNIEKAKTNPERAIALLLAGEIVTAAVMRDRFQATDGSAILNKLFHSHLGVYMTKNYKLKQHEYKMKEDGYGLTPAAALRSYKLGRDLSEPAGVRDIKIKDKPETVTGNTPIEKRLTIPKDINLNINVTFTFKWGD